MIVSRTLQLGWNYNLLLEDIPINEFEEDRCPKRRRYYQYTTGLTALQRRFRLREAGYSNEDIDAASHKAAAGRKFNQKSVARMKFDRVAEFREDVGRCWTRLKVKTGVLRGPEPDDIKLGELPSTAASKTLEAKKS